MSSLNRQHRIPIGRSFKAGQAMVMIAGTLVVLMGMAGLAIDAGRVYLVGVQLSKAVDAAVLGGAKTAGTEDQVKAEMGRIFQFNFPNDYMGMQTAPQQIELTIHPDDREPETGLVVRRIRYAMQARVPLSLLGVLGLPDWTITKRATAYRRVLDIVLVADRSASIGEGPLQIIKEDMKKFVQIFDPNMDRVAIITFAGNVTSVARLGARAGFNRRALIESIDQMEMAGWTASSPAMWDAYQEIITAPPIPGSEARWKIILFFTDGCPNNLHLDARYFTLTRCPNPRDPDQPFCGAMEPCAAAPDPEELIREGAHLGAGEEDNPFKPAQQYIFGLYRHRSRQGQQYEVYSEWGFLSEDDPETEYRNPQGSLIFAPTDLDPQACEDPRHLIGYGGASPDLRRLQPTEPGKELPFVDIYGIPTTPQNRADGGPISRRRVDFVLPIGNTQRRWIEFRRKINGMARNTLENVAHVIRERGITIFSIGLNGEAGQMLRYNREWDEYGRDICKRVANVPDAGDYYNPQQPKGLFVLANDARELDYAFEQVAHAILRLAE